MSCAYLYVHNFPRTHVSRFWAQNLRISQWNALQRVTPCLAMV
jgi:hypothetical protein